MGGPLSINVACLGTSTTQTSSSRSYIDLPLRIEQLLGAGYATANMGIGGQTIGQVNTRFVSQVAYLGYDWLTLNCGLNDIVAGGEIGTIWTNMDNLIDSAISLFPGKVIVMTLQPFSTYNSYDVEMQPDIETFNQNIREKSGIHVVDLYEMLGDSEDPTKMATEYATFQAGGSDGLHMGNVGVDLIAGEIANIILSVEGA